jgi:hypothetical protein
MENIVGPGLSAILAMVYDLDPTQKAGNLFHPARLEE